MPAPFVTWRARWPRALPLIAPRSPGGWTAPVVVQFDEPSLPAALAGRLTGVTGLSPVHPVDESVAAALLRRLRGDGRR